jgi:hypothetical protein
MELIVESSDVRSGFIKPEHTQIYYKIDKDAKIHDDKKKVLFSAIYEEVNDSDQSFDCDAGELDTSIDQFSPLEAQLKLYSNE